MRFNQVREVGAYEEYKTCWGYFNNTYRKAAEEMNIPIAPVAELWNGPEWDIDPADDLGYTSEGIHPSELGYEPVNP